MKFCCPMREKFVVDIVATDPTKPTPVDMIDCIVAWEPKITFRIAYCPFCGKKIERDETTRRRIN